MWWLSFIYFQRLQGEQRLSKHNTIITVIIIIKTLCNNTKRLQGRKCKLRGHDALSRLLSSQQVKAADAALTVRHRFTSESSSWGKCDFKKQSSLFPSKPGLALLYFSLQTLLSFANGDTLFVVGRCRPGEKEEKIISVLLFLSGAKIFPVVPQCLSNQLRNSARICQII